MSSLYTKSIRTVIKKKSSPYYFVVVPLLVTVLFWMISPYNISVYQVSMAFLLFSFPWWSYLTWKKTKSGFPLFSLIAFMFWLCYIFPLFFGGRNLDYWYNRELTYSNIVLDQVILMALVGVLFIWLGMKSKIGRSLVHKTSLDISRHPSEWNYLRFVFICTLLIRYVNPYILGDTCRYIILIIQTTIPLIIFCFFLTQYLHGKAQLIDKILILIYAVSSIMLGLSSALLLMSIQIFICCTLVFLNVRKKLTLWPILVMVLLIIFLLPGRQMVRYLYWHNPINSTSTERAVYWINQSCLIWNKAIEKPEEFREFIVSPINRLSLMNVTAIVLMKTPTYIPYQYGQTYSYLMTGLIPRFFWPQKPSINNSNIFFQIKYGLTRPQEISTVSISCGILAEAYMNFGWLGVIVIMMLMGIFFDVFREVFLSEESGLFFYAIGITTIINLISIESQLAQYIGSLIQQIILSFIILLPSIRIKKLNYQLLIE